VRTTFERLKSAILHGHLLKNCLLARYTLLETESRLVGAVLFHVKKVCSERGLQG
jgi:hypothetical protein